MLLMFSLAPIVCNESCTVNPCHRKAIPTCLNPKLVPSTVFHMTTHPHLDAYWIFNFEAYYHGASLNNNEITYYFQNNRFNSVKEAFDTAERVLTQSAKLRESEIGSNKVTILPQAAYRTFTTSEVGFFKFWFNQLTEERKTNVRSLFASGYWEMLGAGFVQHDEAGAYIDDIVQNFELGRRFMKQNIGVIPRVAISADSFGHSSSTAALQAQMGIEALLLERMDEHMLKSGKELQFIWETKSSNGLSYGSVMAHLRWTIHGFEDQFANVIEQRNNPSCKSKQSYWNNIELENKFLKTLVSGGNIMRYFGHDFQAFSENHYKVIEGLMEHLANNPCEGSVAVYTNPSEYFKLLTLKSDQLRKRTQDIMPIWDYDSSLYWTGYFTTDPLRKKIFRDTGRFLQAARKAYLLTHLKNPSSSVYENLEKLAEHVAYLQHHDGITGTSKYKIMDQLEQASRGLMDRVWSMALSTVFSAWYPTQNQTSILQCMSGKEGCTIPVEQRGHSLYLKVFNSGGNRGDEPFIVNVPAGLQYVPQCRHEIICLSSELKGPCRLYLYLDEGTFIAVKLNWVEKYPLKPYHLKKLNQDDSIVFYNTTHLNLRYDGQIYSIGYQSVPAISSLRSFTHIDRYGRKSSGRKVVVSGKYALGNDPNLATPYSSIKQVMITKTKKMVFVLILWEAQGMKTLVSYSVKQPSQWTVETLSALGLQPKQDLFLQVGSTIKNGDKFHTDSNGWLVTQRTLFKHSDYKPQFPENHEADIDGNTYPMTAFSYIQDASRKVSINTDRAQGVIALKEGILWVNIDRITADDGKWVFEETWRSQYQRFVHKVCVQKPKQYAERTIQRLYDQPILAQFGRSNFTQSENSVTQDLPKRHQWTQRTNLDKIKFTIRPVNDSTTLLRLYNFDDANNVSVSLASGNVSIFLTSYYGVGFTHKSIEEMALGGDITYKEFLTNKWLWGNKNPKSKQQNQNNFEAYESLSSFSTREAPQQISLGPLQIRTFLLTGLTYGTDADCPSRPLLAQKINPSNSKVNVGMKASPSQLTVKMPFPIIDYLRSANKCEWKSPVTGGDKSWIQKLINDKKTEFTVPQQLPSAEVKGTTVKPISSNKPTANTNQPNPSINQPIPPSSQQVPTVNKPTPIINKPISTTSQLNPAISQQVQPKTVPNIQINPNGALKLDAQDLNENKPNKDTLNDRQGGN